MNIIIFLYLLINLSRYIISFLVLNPLSLLNSLRYFLIILFDFMKFRILLSQIMISFSFHISEKLYSNFSILINDYLYHFTFKPTIKSKEWTKSSNNISTFIAIINKIINQIFFFSSNSSTTILNIRLLIIFYFILIINIILNLIWIFINFSSISFLQSKKWLNISKLYMKIFLN